MGLYKQRATFALATFFILFSTVGLGRKAPDCVVAMARGDQSRRPRLPATPASQAVAPLLPASDTQVLAPDPAANLAEFLKRKEFRVGTFNVENLFLSVGKFLPNPKTGQREKVKDGDDKDPAERARIAQAIFDMDYDIAFLQEVEYDAAEEFCKSDLKGRYSALRIRGNDGRRIEVVAIVKKGLPLEVTYESHKKEPYNNPLYPDMRRVFSRDVPAMIVRVAGTKNPLFVFLGVHGKSKRTEIEADPESESIRRDQAARLTRIAQAYAEQYGCPVFVGGDFNDRVNQSQSYAPLRDAGFKDAFDLAQREKIPVGDPRRITHTYHPRGGRTEKGQLDAVMVGEKGHGLVLFAEVYKYLDAKGNPIPIPETYEERERQPSDHRPVVVGLDLQGLLRAAGVIP